MYVLTSFSVIGALAIGAGAGLGCFFAATTVKRAFGYDDALDVFGVHAVGGIIGALLTGVFAATALGGRGFADGKASIAAQVGAQSVGVAATIVYTAVSTFVILKILDLVIGLRVSEEEESEGLDLALHDERGYIL